METLVMVELTRIEKSLEFLLRQYVPKMHGLGSMEEHNASTSSDRLSVSSKSMGASMRYEMRILQITGH